MLGLGEMIGLSAASSAFGFGSNLLGSSLSGNSARAQMRYQKELQDRQFEFQEKYYRHQHQWEIEDLEAAGLNPILSAMHGPIGGGMVSSHPIVPPDMSAGVKETSLGLARLAMDRDLARSQEELNSAKADTEWHIKKNLGHQDDLKIQETQNAQYIHDHVLPAEARLKDAEALERLVGAEEKRALVSYYGSAALNQRAQATAAYSAGALHDVEKILKGYDVKRGHHGLALYEDDVRSRDGQFFGRLREGFRVLHGR
jgi:hypothetical protein